MSSEATANGLTGYGSINVSNVKKIKERVYKDAHEPERREDYLKGTRDESMGMFVRVNACCQALTNMSLISATSCSGRSFLTRLFELDTRDTTVNGLPKLFL